MRKQCVCCDKYFFAQIEDETACEDCLIEKATIMQNVESSPTDIHKIYEGDTCIFESEYYNETFKECKRLNDLGEYNIYLKTEKTHCTKTKDMF